MPLLARKILKSALWAEADNHWADDDFPYALLTELSDARARGLSTFVCKSETDPFLERVAAALFVNSESKAVESAQFRFVRTEELTELGLSFEYTPGKLSDNIVKQQHVDIKGLSGRSAVELARVFFRNPVAELPANVVLKAIGRGIRLKYYQSDRNFKIKPDLLKELYNKSALRIHERSIV